jgi:hypothetical protein
MVGSVCGTIVRDIYIVLFRTMGLGHQEDVYFLGVVNIEVTECGATVVGPFITYIVPEPFCRSSEE